MSILTKLTEGIRSRDLQKEGDALLSKWEQTGLLEGMTTDVQKNGMARLLENQASQLLKESSSMSGGDVEGFASVAFPLVRRVFGGLLANDIVSVQPMSLPSGLIFFLDFTYNTARLGGNLNGSVYGGGVVASEITGGVSDITEEGGGMYNLAEAYASPTGSATITLAAAPAATGIELTKTIAEIKASDVYLKAVRFDPDLLGGDSTIEHSQWTFAAPTNLNKDDVRSLDLTPLSASHSVIRRLTSISGDTVTVTIGNTGGATTVNTGASIYSAVYSLADNFNPANATGAVIGASQWGLEEQTAIPEIDIKVDSIAVTAITKKLKAKWSPELGQDLNAYHNLDAEVELTSILSEQIALEIDREILGDLVEGATAGTYYWSRSPGLFVDRSTGAEIGASALAPDFTGTVSEWYETLVETINDVSAQIHRKTLRGGANFIVVSPEVANILEFTAGFRASITADADSGSVGAVKVGAMSKKWDVYVDPYFPRNVVLVGRKGGSFLESGYVYAPYVPLQVTPTIFGTEDFVPRKGVMTRYAKKMVRPDMYGLVVVRGLLGESGG